MFRPLVEAFQGEVSFLRHVWSFYQASKNYRPQLESRWGDFSSLSFPKSFIGNPEVLSTLDSLQRHSRMTNGPINTFKDDEFV